MFICYFTIGVMSANSDDEIPHKRQRLSSETLGEEDHLIAKCNECQIRDLDSVTDGNYIFNSFSNCLCSKELFFFYFGRVFSIVIYRNK